jgi:hypothetical protein
MQSVANLQQYGECLASIREPTLNHLFFEACQTGRSGHSPTMSLAPVYVWLQASDCTSSQRMRSMPFASSQSAILTMASIIVISLSFELTAAGPSRRDRRW